MTKSAGLVLGQDQNTLSGIAESLEHPYNRTTRSSQMRPAGSTQLGDLLI
jgi:hypothetical protein